MTQPSDDAGRDEIIRLLLASNENELATDEVTRLDDLLRNSPAARLAYLSHVELLGDLYWSKLSESREGAVRDECTAAMGATSTDLFGRKPLDSLAELLTSSQHAFPHVMPAATNTWRRSPMMVFALVACVFYGAFVLIAWNLRSSPGRRNAASPVIASENAVAPPINDNPLAQLTRADDAQWKHDSGASAENSHREHTLQVRSGLAELEFSDGAKVIVEGPAEVEVRSGNSGFLRRGKLVATVPQRAIGFTIETSLTRVVDLGTEFGVEADESGATNVQVFQGKVELRPDANRGNAVSAVEPVEPITLAAGAARRVEPNRQKGGVIVREIIPSSDRFARQPPTDPAQVKQIPVEGAYASSAHSALNVDDLIRGRGLKGDCHSSNWKDAMWHSSYGEIKNVFVSFDLARSHRLKLMKVWNFNDSRYEWAGVKQADIYVSTSGKGDPLSQPAEWKLVAESQQFAPGTGRDDYATPTAVPLGNVEARFVTIVIDDALGRDPRKLREPDIVGLSEVQFFGQRLEPKARRK